MPNIHFDIPYTSPALRNITDLASILPVTASVARSVRTLHHSHRVADSTPTRRAFAFLQLAGGWVFKIKVLPLENLPSAKHLIY